MKEIDKKIKQHTENSKRLKMLYIANDEISFQKTTELRKLQDEEYKKMIFFQNLKKGMNK